MKNISESRVCVFCQKKGNLTREHVLPDWLRNHFPEEGKVTHELLGTSKKQWLAGIFQHKVKIVCSSCNNGWMSQLEGNVIPIFGKLFKLEKSTLNQYEQQVLAFWVQKTILMLNSSTPGGLKITQDLYDDLFIKKAFSKKVMVNIGWRLNTDKQAPIVSFQVQQVPSVSFPNHLENIVVLQKNNGGFIWKAVLAIGSVVFETVGHNMQVVLEVGSDTRVFKSIQPYKFDLIWPLEFPLESEGGLEVIKMRL